MKTISEKLELCKVCKKRKFDPSCGIVCGLTNEKPAFEEECPELDADEDLVNEQKRTEELSKDADEILDGKMPGSNWFLWIAGLSILNIGLYFVRWRFFFGLGSTQIFQELMLIDLIPVPLGVLCMLMLPAFFLWTWWATAKSGIKLFYKIGWVVFLVDTLIYLVLCALTIHSYLNANLETVYSIFILVIDIILHIAVLFYGFKLSQLKQIEGNSTSSAHKVGYIVYLVISLIVSILALCYSVVRNVTSDPAATFEIAMNTVKSKLPVKVDEFTTFEKIEKNGNEVRFEYALTNIKLDELDPSFAKTYPVVAKQNLLDNIEKMSPFEVLCWEQGYTIVAVYTVDYNVIFDITITPDEYKAAIAKTK